MSARAPFVLAQISDTHVEAAPRADGFCCADNLRRALAHPELEVASALLLTGDLVDDGTPAEYAALRDALSGWGKPLFALNGNHDAREAFRAAFSDQPGLPAVGDCSYVIEDMPFRLVVFDVTEPGRIGGLVTPERAAWLDRALAQSNRATMVALHYPAVDTLDRDYSAHGLDGQPLLQAVIARHPHVQIVVNGHMHELGFGRIAQAAHVCAPSTAWRHAPPAALRGGAGIRKEPGGTGFLLHLYEPGIGFLSHAVWI